MARYDHLPIWKDAMTLAGVLEEAVRRFPRYHRFGPVQASFYCAENKK